MKKQAPCRYSQPFSILREGVAIGSTAFVIGVIVGFFVSAPLACPFIIFGAWAVYFFRDPVRVPPDSPGVAISPADGLIVSVKEKNFELAQELGPMHCISIFMNALDVHVNRIPLAAKITNITHIKGRFFNATLDKASLENERCIYTCKAEDDTVFFVVQIAGFVARRIVPFCTQGAQLVMGERLGLIRFGSRVDFYLPKKFSILIKEGQRTIAGETVMAQEK